jgi:hypothetical protein
MDTANYNHMRIIVELYVWILNKAKAKAVPLHAMKALGGEEI